MEKDQEGKLLGFNDVRGLHWDRFQRFKLSYKSRERERARGYKHVYIYPEKWGGGSK